MTIERVMKRALASGIFELDPQLDPQSFARSAAGNGAKQKANVECN